MRCWGPGSFDNDEALDWFGPFARAESKADFIQETLNEVFSSDYLRQDVSERAIAAAEVVACLANRAPINMDLPEEFFAVRESCQGLPLEKLRKLARAAVQRIAGADQEVSELSQMETYSTHADLKAAHDSLADLAERLA